MRFVAEGNAVHFENRFSRTVAVVLMVFLVRVRMGVDNTVSVHVFMVMHMSVV